MLIRLSNKSTTTDIHHPFQLELCECMVVLLELKETKAIKKMEKSVKWEIQKIFMLPEIIHEPIICVNRLK